MVKFKKINKESKKIKINENFSPSRIRFNLSFMTNDKKYNLQNKSLSPKEKSKILEKMEFLSKSDYVHILNLPKTTGLEKINESEVKLRKNSDFTSSGRNKLCDEYFWIFRISYKGRVIGKAHDLDFYIMSVDVSFDAYKH